MCDASSGSLSSYAYILLLLHYLQQVKPPVIPVLQQVSFNSTSVCMHVHSYVFPSVYPYDILILSNQIGGGGNVIVDGWNCWFYQFSDLSQLVSE